MLRGLTPQKFAGGTLGFHSELTALIADGFSGACCIVPGSELPATMVAVLCNGCL